MRRNSAFASTGIGAPSISCSTTSGKSPTTNRMAIVAHLYGVAREDGAPMGSDTFDGAHVSTFHGARRKRVKVGREFLFRK